MVGITIMFHIVNNNVLTLLYLHGNNIATQQRKVYRMSHNSDEHKTVRRSNGGIIKRIVSAYMNLRGTTDSAVGKPNESHRGVLGAVDAHYVLHGANLRGANLSGTEGYELKITEKGTKP